MSSLKSLQIVESLIQQVDASTNDQEEKSASIPSSNNVGLGKKVALIGSGLIGRNWVQIPSLRMHFHIQLPLTKYIVLRIGSSLLSRWIYGSNVRY